MYLYIILIFLILVALGLQSKFKFKTTASRIPGPFKTDPVQGNLPDLVAAGSVHAFLKDLHRRYGPLVRFWLGQRQLVSIASPSLMKQQAHVFDRPRDLHLLFEQLWGRHTMVALNGIKGKEKHAAFSRCFTHNALQKRYHILQKQSEDLCTKWASLAAGEHIALSDHMMTFTIKVILGILFGGYFAENKQVQKMKEAYSIVWNELEYRVLNAVPDEKHEQKFQKYKQVIFSLVEDVLNKVSQTDLDKDMFLHVVQQFNDSLEVMKSNMVTMFVGGFHTTAFLLVWCVYYLASNPDLQDKLYREVIDLVGEETIPFEALGKMNFMRQMLDETLRCATVAPYSTRVQSHDSKLGSYTIPAGTAVVLALGVMQEDESLWSNPNKFDPERFIPEKRKNIPSYAFEPFGFAGKRKCPAYRLAYAEVSLLLADLVRRFHINLVDGQKIEKVYGFVTKPKEEVWVTVNKRK